jgi:hypothetical protein
VREGEQILSVSIKIKKEQKADTKKMMCTVKS